MVEYSKVNVKLTNTQLKKLKTTVKNKIETTLRMSSNPWMKVAVPSPKTILAPLGITAAALAIDAGIKKKKKWFRNINFNNFKCRNEWHNENCSSFWGF